MIISKQICSYCSNESEIPQEFQEREPSSNSTQETGSNTTVVFSANSSQNSFRIGGGFFVGVEFKYANINVNSTSGSKVTPTEHFYCKDEDLKLPRVSFAVVLCSLFWDKPWNCSFATRFTLLLLNYRYQFFRQRFYTYFTYFTNMSCHLTRLRILMIVLLFIHHRLRRVFTRTILLADEPQGWRERLTDLHTAATRDAIRFWATPNLTIFDYGQGCCVHFRRLRTDKRDNGVSRTQIVRGVQGTCPPTNFRGLRIPFQPFCREP